MNDIETLREQIKALTEPFAPVDGQDWEHLDTLLGQSGHGQFWRQVLSDFRKALEKRS